MRLRTICFSIIFHVLVIIVLTVGFGWSPKKKTLETPPTVSVEIVKVAEKTQTNKKSSKKSNKKINRKKAQNKKKKTESKPKQARKKPAKAATNKSNNMSAIPIKNNKDDNKAKDEKQAKMAKTVKPPKTPPLKKPPKKDKKAASSQEFSSLLKNLADGQKQTEKHTKKPIKSKEDSMNDFLDSLNLEDEKDTHDLPLGDSLTISEVDLLRRQLSNCWSIPIGARNAENLVIDIFMVVNSDRTVHHAKIVDQSKYQRDSFFRAAADSALRAVHNPECSPLELPADKYAMWNEIIVTFDPQNMF